MSLPKLELISHALCPYVQRSIITLSEKDIDHSRTYIDLSDKPDWFLAISPLGKVPALRIDDDAVLFESAVICEYLDEITPGSLHPQDPLEKARHRSWIEFGSATLDAIAGFYNAKDEETFNNKTDVLKERFARLETVIAADPYFESTRFHMVDAVWATVFRYFDVFDRIADFGVFDGLDKVRRYRANLSKRPTVIDAVGSDYPDLLMDFLERRNSYISGLIEPRKASA